jgi:hypothetical protein
MSRSRKTFILFCGLCCLIIFSSFALLEIETGEVKVLSSIYYWVSDHSILTLLAVSEAAGVLPTKVKGIVHGLLVGFKSIFGTRVKPRTNMRKI